jgi:hypothetical protein
MSAPSLRRGYVAHMRARFILSISCAVAVGACASGTLSGTEDTNPPPDGDAAPPTEAGASDSTVADTGSTEFADTGPESTVGSHDASESGADAPTDSPPAPMDAPSDALPDAFDAADASCGVPPDGGLPGGSYSATCSGCSVTGTTLSCACQNDSQVYVPASLDLCTCAQPLVINNLNGVLTCG